MAADINDWTYDGNSLRRRREFHPRRDVVQARLLRLLRPGPSARRDGTLHGRRHGRGVRVRRRRGGLHLDVFVLVLPEPVVVVVAGRVLPEPVVVPASLAPPSQMVVGVWSRPGVIKHDAGYTSPTKVYWAPSVSGSLGRACGCDGLTEDEYRTTVLQPFGKGRPVYLANNDWVAQNVNYFFGDWAEESLLQCERALYRLGEPRPAWLNASYYQEKIVTKA